MTRRRLPTLGDAGVARVSHDQDPFILAMQATE
jgi:hypothetical protein